MSHKKGKDVEGNTKVFVYIFRKVTTDGLKKLNSVYMEENNVEEREIENIFLWIYLMQFGLWNNINIINGY